MYRCNNNAVVLFLPLPIPWYVEVYFIFVDLQNKHREVPTCLPANHLSFLECPAPLPQSRSTIPISMISVRAVAFQGAKKKKEVSFCGGHQWLRLFSDRRRQVYDDLLAGHHSAETIASKMIVVIGEVSVRQRVATSKKGAEN